MQPYGCTDTVTSWKNLRFILSERSGLQIVNNLLIAIYTLLMRMLTSFSVDKVYELVN